MTHVFIENHGPLVEDVRRGAMSHGGGISTDWGAWREVGREGRENNRQKSYHVPTCEAL